MRAPLPIALLAIATTIVLLGGGAAQAQTSEAATDTPAPPAAPTPSPPFTHDTGAATPSTPDLDAATARALELESAIDALQADSRAIAERLAMTSERIALQRGEVEAAERAFEEATERFRARLVEVYKRGSFDPIMLLFSSDSLTDLVTRADVLGRIAADDSRVVADLNLAAADARFQHGVLADLQAQDRALARAHEEHLEELQRLLGEQEELVARLTAEAREALLRARSSNASTRDQWRGSSVAVGTRIARATATVDTHPGETFLVSAYMPRAYRSTGRTFAAVCSWYGPGFNGRTTASGQTFNEDDFTCASRTLPFGTVLALTRGDRRIIVYVNDRGPYIDGRDLDLSKAAAAALGFGGVATVQVEVVNAAQ